MSEVIGVTWVGFTLSMPCLAGSTGSDRVESPGVEVLEALRSSVGTASLNVWVIRHLVSSRWSYLMVRGNR